MNRPDAVDPDSLTLPAAVGPAAPGTATRTGTHTSSHASSTAGGQGDRRWWAQLDALVGLPVDTDTPAGQQQAVTSRSGPRVAR
jgi:hypothetical protein